MSQGSDLELSVVSTALPSLVKDASTPELDLSLTPQDHPSCPPSPLAPLAFNVYLAVSEVNATDTLAASLDALVTDPQPLLALLPPPVAAALTPKVCAASLTKVVRTVYPPVERMPAFSPRTLGLFGPAVMLSVGDEIAPPRRVTVGRSYNLQVINFPTDTKLQVRTHTHFTTRDRGAQPPCQDPLRGVPRSSIPPSSSCSCSSSCCVWCR
jgi:hypothetical protein